MRTGHDHIWVHGLFTKRNSQRFQHAPRLFGAPHPNRHSCVTEPANVQICEVCDEISTFRCARCKKTWYCSRQHQVPFRRTPLFAHWARCSVITGGAGTKQTALSHRFCVDLLRRPSSWLGLAQWPPGSKVHGCSFASEYVPNCGASC